MKFDDINLNDKVIDCWYTDFGIGIIIKKLKTVIHVKFINGVTWIYDKPHTRFLEKYEQKLHNPQIQ